MSGYAWLLTIVAAIGFIGCVTFIISYTVKSKGGWRDSEIGKFMVVIYANLAALFGLVMLNQILRDWAGRQTVSAILFTAYAIEAWWPLRLWHQARRRSQADNGAQLEDQVHVESPDPRR